MIHRLFFHTLITSPKMMTLTRNFFDILWRKPVICISNQLTFFVRVSDLKLFCRWFDGIELLPPEISHSTNFVVTQNFSPPNSVDSFDPVSFFEVFIQVVVSMH